jgi:hypothetical protein
LTVKRYLLSFTFGLTAAVTTLSAHHSISGVYDSSQQVKIEGVVAEFHFVNPHPYLMVEVQGKSGRPETWKLDMDNRSELVDVGMTNQTFKPGDRIVASGSPIRPPHSQGLYLRKLDRPADGFEYEQVGSSPRIRHAKRSTKRQAIH